MDGNSSNSLVNAGNTTTDQVVFEHRLEHYSANIAPKMVWLDSSDNPYKRLVVPSARQHHILGDAISHVSFFHEARQRGTTGNTIETSTQSMIKKLAAEIGKMTNLDGFASTYSEAESSNLVSILASILVLSNSSLMESHIFVAQMHRHAARTIVRAFPAQATSQDELFKFLKEQLAIYDILASTTTFTPKDVRDAITFDEHGSHAVFGQYLNVIHRITVQAVERDTNGTQAKLILYAALVDELELARASTLLVFGSWSRSFSKPECSNFIRLVDAHHHAGILYANSRLKMGIEKDVKRYHVGRLYQILELLEGVEAHLQNLPWVLFIAGICSYDQSRWGTVMRICSKLCDHIGFGHFTQLQRFLVELADKQDNRLVEELDWMPLAKEWEKNGVPLVLIT